MNLSHSRINTFASCPRKYDLIYNEHIFPLEDSSALSVGKAFHYGVEHKSIDECIEYMEDDNYFLNEKAETDKVLVLAMLDGYLKRYSEEKVIATELELEVKIGGHKLRVIIDEIVERDGKFYLVDLKTSSATPDFDKYKSQMLKYYYVILQNLGSLPVDRIDGVIIKAVMKTRIRQKKTETIEQFRIRLEEEYKTNEDLIVEHMFDEISPVELSDELSNTNMWATMMKLAISTDLYPENKTSCDMYGACPYKPLCKGYEGADALYEVKATDTDNLETTIENIKKDIETMKLDLDILFEEE